RRPMAWERRKSGARFYYRSRRAPNGRVVKVYFGRGPRAKKAAREDAAIRTRQDADRLALLDEQTRLARQNARMKELEDAASLLTTAELLASGYHQLNYGPWRKRRGNERSQATARTESPG